MKTIFTSDVVGHRDIKEFQPQPAKNFMPDWYKKMPSDVKYDTDYNKIPNFRTAKLCPNFSDIFNEGFVLPEQFDMWLIVHGDGVDDWIWKTSNSAFDIEMHGQGQLNNYLPNPIVRQIFKLNYPWRIIVPKGYSIRQIPLFYDYNPDWHVAYGVLKADVVHEINLQICYTSKEEEVFIKAGEPLCYYVPFKREESKLVIDNNYDKYKAKIDGSMHRALSKFKNGYRRFNK